ncbi:E3 ubiquitin-protein ligase TRIM8 [Coregonus clupeaformis]|uniref:E3 ubiquitin-protein ligase TRIM8 n=1 Tax=Coregonus clupeaformis TaxID=59861 RepID=UPI001E1C9BCD|nr:E3 ubiquitin-protein ligase TRIM8 [Coregonus clupeaformis]
MEPEGDPEVMSRSVKQERVESPAPSCLSMKSDRSKGQDINFSGGACPPDPSASLLTEDLFKCSVCSEVLMDLVSIPCGHSYCRQCISTYWVQPCPPGDYVCLQCCKRSRARPALITNTALARVLQGLQQAGFSPALPALSYAGPGDMACDICSGQKLRAVKSCLTCTVSYCESHVRQHYTIPALQRHTLAEVTGDGGHKDHHGNAGLTESIKEETETEEEERENVSKKRKIIEVQEEEEDSYRKISDLKNTISELKKEISDLKNLEQENCKRKHDFRELSIKKCSAKTRGII